jgi:hypothetical protein
MPLDPMKSDEWQRLAPWDKYRSDLTLTVSHTLTEPTCPTATVEFELPERAGKKVIASYHGNTIKEAIDGALLAASVWLTAETARRTQGETP